MNTDELFIEDSDVEEEDDVFDPDDYDLDKEDE